MRRSLATDDVRPVAAARVYADLDTTVSCPRCGVIAPWGALVRTTMLEGPALASNLAVPPDGWAVDVRACRRCGHSLARKVRA